MTEVLTIVGAFIIIIFIGFFLITIMGLGCIGLLKVFELFADWIDY